MGRRRISVLRRPRPYVVNMTKAILFPVTPRPLSAGGSPSSWARSAILASSMSLYGDDQTGGGVYLWSSRDAAERFYSDSWKSTIAQRYGAQPEVLFYESPVIVENADENAATAAA